MRCKSCEEARETVEERDRIVAQHRSFSALNMSTDSLEELTT
jgi:hypothetical protein